MGKSKFLQIISGIFTALIIWGIAPLFAGKFVFGDLLDFADNGMLPFVYPLLFCAVLVAVGIFAGKNNKSAYFKSALISFASPAGFGLLFWIGELINQNIYGSFASPLVFLGLPISFPVSVVEGMTDALGKFGLKSYDTKTLVIAVAAMAIPVAVGFVGAIAAYRKYSRKSD